MTAVCKLKKRRPSPVNISSLRAKPKLYPPLNWSEEYGDNFSSPLVLCEGDAIRVYLSEPEGSFIWGGPLSAKYVFRNITFHWSLKINKGSEHAFDDKHYPVEMQVVHEKIEPEDDSKDAKEADNFLVVSYMFELSDIPNEPLQNILDMVPRSIKYSNQLIPSEPFQLRDLVQKFTKNYLFYKGQLTEPQFDTCYWLFCPCKLQLSPKQLCIFKKCSDYKPEMANNYKPVQSLNKRKCGCSTCTEKRKKGTETPNEKTPSQVNTSKKSENGNGCGKFKCEICEKYAEIDESVLCSSFCQHLFSPAGQEDKCTGSCSRKSSNKTENKSV